MLGKELQRVRLIPHHLSISPCIRSWSSGLGHELCSLCTEAHVPGLAVARRPVQRKQHAKPAPAQGRLPGRKHTAQTWRVRMLLLAPKSICTMLWQLELGFVYNQSAPFCLIEIPVSACLHSWSYLLWSRPCGLMCYGLFEALHCVLTCTLGLLDCLCLKV